MTSKFKSIRGFTLIETLLAVLLLTTAIAGPLTIASRGLNSALVAKDQITAFYLAQDAVEHIRFVRDSACLAATPDATGCPAASWLSTLLAKCMPSGGNVGCYIDSIQNTVEQCTGGACPALKYDASNKFFSYTAIGAVETPQNFVRTVTLTTLTADEAVVTVSVSWRNLAGVTHPPIVVRENIFRWQ